MHRGSAAGCGRERYCSLTDSGFARDPSIVRPRTRHGALVIGEIGRKKPFTSPILFVLFPVST